MNKEKAIEFVLTEDKMKYSIFYDFEDNCCYITNNRSKEYTTEIKVYESDSLHDCFGWASANDKILYSDMYGYKVDASTCIKQKKF